MRSRYVRAVLGILVLAVFGTQLFTSTITAITIEASVDVKPETFNLKENGVFTAFIELPSPYNVTDIDGGSIKLHMDNAEDYVVPIRCVIADGKFTVKFDALNVADYILSKLVHMQIPPPQANFTITLVVEGMFLDLDQSLAFEGHDEIRIISP